MNGAGDPRRLCGEALVAALRRVRATTIAATQDLSDRQWRVPYDPFIQPVAWDLGHVGWFQEFFALRGPHGLGADGTARATKPGHFFADDEHYDSARIAHLERWRMQLLPRSELYGRLAELLEATAARLLQGPDPDELWGARLALFHECMHREALLWTRATLGYPAPAAVAMPTVRPRDPVRHAGGEVQIGHRGGDEGFAFDNECPARTVTLAPFSIDAVPVTNGGFLEFVTAGGYGRPELWPGEAADFRARLDGRDHPERWRRTPDGAFEQRWFDGWRPLAADEPVCHVSAFEAEAYCRFVDRRLPTAAEWEAAAAQIDWGESVWEWTATTFAPYPNFRPSPYTTYSAPWFHHQRELRGGAYATDALMHDRAYRNFFLPYRTDVFAGFRTAGS
ncbi:MAG: SUMF1/EgtB/PvdO family nonheme iron enzyme [Planctomycetes bacterium]|nr:SUMF1/EgtB/PvdO family nonheme iron enzyme [Planctomycetota bacterium]